MSQDRTLGFEGLLVEEAGARSAAKPNGVSYWKPTNRARDKKLKSGLRLLLFASRRTH